MIKSIKYVHKLRCQLEKHVRIIFISLYVHLLTFYRTKSQNETFICIYIYIYILFLSRVIVSKLINICTFVYLW